MTLTRYPITIIIRSLTLKCAIIFETFFPLCIYISKVFSCPCGFLWIDLKHPHSTPPGQGHAGRAEVLQSLGGLPLLPSDEEGAARQGRPSGRDPVLITWTSIV